jgi:hypothetical protein
MRRYVVLAVVAVLLALGCAPEGDQPQQGDPTGRVVNDPTEALATPEMGLDEPSAAPGPTSDLFAIDEAAHFDDGLVVEVAGATATTAEQRYRGAEATRGDMVVVSVRIENGTQEPFPTDDIAMTVTYGDGVAASPVTDPGRELQDSFTGVIEVTEELVGIFGFAVPFDQLSEVSVTVDCGDGIHGPVTFIGPITRG